MNPAIETRELVSLAIDGIRLRGTYHRPHGHGSSSQRSPSNRVGVLLINPGCSPRAAFGDSAVYWADSFAKCGYPSFRFDLPGLGDSEGEVPVNMLDVINSGEYAPVISALANSVVVRFNLSGVVIMGLCAGAVSALFAASIAGCESCKGLILMNPYFFRAHIKPRILIELRGWPADGKLGPLARNIYASVRDAYDRLRFIGLRLRGNRPPRNANLHLIRSWSQLSLQGMPMLVLKSPELKARSAKLRIGEFDYLGYLQNLSGGSNIVVRLVEGANHAFGNRVGKAAIQSHTEHWLKTHFPMSECENSAPLSSSRLTSA